MGVRVARILALRLQEEHAATARSTRPSSRSPVRVAPVIALALLPRSGRAMRWPRLVAGVSRRSRCTSRHRRGGRAPGADGTVNPRREVFGLFAEISRGADHGSRDRRAFHGFRGSLPRPTWRLYQALKLRPSVSSSAIERNPPRPGTRSGRVLCQTEGSEASVASNPGTPG